jgi:putative Mg2+ transporter-C (MgtC) family protein
VGAALFTMISINLADLTGKGGDPGRIAAQIVSGIGFLGAGTILKSGFTVRGLTTAACMWLVAAIGMACAVGWVFQAILLTGAVLLVLLSAKRIEHKVHRLFTLKITVVSASDDISLRMCEFLTQRSGLVIVSMDNSVDYNTMLYNSVYLVETKTHRGLQEVLHELFRDINAIERNLKNLKIESIR